MEIIKENKAPHAEQDITFELMKRGEIREASELAARAFEDYRYVTNFFPGPGESLKMLKTLTHD